MQRWHNLPKKIKGILLFVAAWMIVPFMDVGAKLLGDSGHSPLFITWLRYLATALILVPALLIFSKIESIKLYNWRTQTVRSVALTGATFCYFTAIQYMPLADALSIYFIYPLLVTVLASLLLRESVTLIQWTLVLIGFFGILIIVRPGFEDISPALSYLLLGAFFFAIYHVLTRAVSQLASHWDTLIFQVFIGLVLTSAPLPWVWETITLSSTAIIIMIGLASISGHLMMIKAYSYSEATDLAPFGYFEIISTTALGFFVFNDFPDFFTVLGASIIILCGIISGLQKRPK